MKAKLYGIEVEGTPEEISELKIQLDKQHKKMDDNFKYPHPNEYFSYPVIIGDPPSSPIKWDQITCNSNKNI